MPQTLNSDASLEGKTITVNENNDTITGLKTFDRDPNPPFAVSASSAVVPNLDADKVDGIEGADLLKKDGTVAMTGTLDLGTPGKIKFPATQSASADANTLDDYEEGTWTPVLQFGGASTGITYSAQEGHYIKIGGWAHLEFRIALTNKGSATGVATITGNSFNAAGNAVVGSPLDFPGAGAGLTSPFSVMGAGSGTIFLVQNSATVRGQLTEANFANTTDVRGTISFRM